MFSVKTLIVATLLAQLALVVESSHWVGDNNYDKPFDISKKSDLTTLYNFKVYLAERMSRPLDNLSFKIGIVSHSGVVVTLGDGSRWLIHKGDAYGDNYDTIVVDAKYMSSDWKIIKTKNFNGMKKVADFVADGGSDYSLIFNNCRKPSGQMMKKKD